MKMIETSNDAIEFAFEHSKDYQHIQFAFIDAVESLDHNNIIVCKILIFKQINNLFDYLKYRMFFIYVRFILTL